jgi:hypothetical protein
MSKLLQSAFLLLDSILYSADELGYTRSEYKAILEKKNLPNSPTAITRVLRYIEKNYEMSLKFGRQGGCSIKKGESSPFAIENFKFSKQLFFKDYLYKLSDEYEYSKDILSFSFDTHNKNSDLLPQLISAILEKRYIEFQYKTFGHITFKAIKIAPYFIKEYLNRWYVIGKSEKFEHQVFSLDRISKLEVLDTTHTFKPKPVKEIFNDTIGVNFSGKKTKVRLWTTKKQYAFFETLPLHHSQKLDQETEEGYIFSIEVKLNFELERWILYYGAGIKVLEPENLKVSIENELKKTLEFYT